MSKFRFRFAKDQDVRFVSHLDTMKVFERSIRRAGLPIAFSEGFNPHPKIALGSALAVGVTSEAEYGDIELREAIPVSEVADRLGRALPNGYRLLDLKQLDGKVEALMAIINRAEYQIVLETTEAVTDDSIAVAIEKLLAQEHLPIKRDTKRGIKDTDIRPGLFSIKGKAVQEKVVELNILVETGSAGNIRPDEVIRALEQISGLSVEPGYRIKRIGLYVHRDDQILSPMVC